MEVFRNSTSIGCKVRWDYSDGSIARNVMTRISLHLETSVTFLSHVLHVLLWEPMASRTLTEVASLPCT